MHSYAGHAVTHRDPNAARGSPCNDEQDGGHKTRAANEKGDDGYQEALCNHVSFLIHWSLKSQVSEISRKLFLSDILYNSVSRNLKIVPRTTSI